VYPEPSGVAQCRRRQRRDAERGVDGELDQRDEVPKFRVRLLSPSRPPLAGNLESLEERSTSAMTPLTRSTSGLPVVLWRCGEPTRRRTRKTGKTRQTVGVFPELKLLNAQRLRPYLLGPAGRDPPPAAADSEPWRARRRRGRRCRSCPSSGCAMAARACSRSVVRWRRWAGCDSSGDTWEPLEPLTYCEAAAALAAFEQATGRAMPRPAQSPPAAAAAAPPPLPLSGFTVESASTRRRRAT
jgi:hypothetical protein